LRRGCGDFVSLVILFLNAPILVPVTLLPIINPLATAPVFVATFGGNRAVAQRLARQIAINSWFVMVASMLLGTHILALFGISLPVVRLGGGLLLAAAGWRMLHHTEDDESIRPPPSRRPGSPMPRSCGGASSR
jgi:multiple antibiotic resistance protein